MLACVREEVAFAGQIQRQQSRIVRDSPERDDHTHTFQLRELGLQVDVAAADFVRQGLVLRWHAFDGVSDTRITQLQGIVGGDGTSTGAETELMQRFIEQNSGVISGERPPRAIRAVQAGCEANDQDARVCRAKRRDRARPVVRVAAMYFGKEGSKTWAAGAIRIVDYLRAAANCASSVEPLSAVVDDVPAQTTWVTSSK